MSSHLFYFFYEIQNIVVLAINLWVFSLYLKKHLQRFLKSPINSGVLEFKLTPQHVFSPQLIVGFTNLHTYLNLNMTILGNLVNIVVLATNLWVFSLYLKEHAQRFLKPRLIEGVLSSNSQFNIFFHLNW